VLHGIGILSVFFVGTVGVLYYLRWTSQGQSEDA
jgi:hypothetical protein